MSNHEKLGGGGESVEEDANITQSRRIVSPREEEMLGLPGESRSNEEILESDTAKRVLPYLTLDELSDNEKADLLSLAEQTISSMKNGNLPKNSFAVNEFLENLVAKISRDYEEYNNGGLISTKLEIARKLFCACLLDGVNENNSDDPREKYEIYERFFSFSPSFSSYCGGIEGSLELLTIAEREEHNPCTRNIYGEIVYNSSFSSENEYANVLSGSEPIRRLRLLPIMRNVAAYCDADSWNEPTLYKISGALNLEEHSTETTPLVRIVAESIGKEIDYKIHAEWEILDPDSNPEHAKLIQQDMERRKLARIRFIERQAKLHDEFPSFSEEQILTRFAPDMVATKMSSGGIDIIADKDGNSASLLRYAEDNSFGIDRETADLLSAAHTPAVKSLIDEKLGLDLVDIPLDSQIQLLKFMTEADDGRFDRLCSTLRGLDEKVRLKLAKGFLAAGFGEDFGDALLDIADSDKISGEQLGEILDKIDSCRKSIHGITGFYDGFDGGDFAKQYERAANERLTDALAVFRKIAKTGHASADLGWAGTPEFNYETAMEALDYETKSLEIINGTLSDIGAKKEGAFAERILTPDEYRRRSEYRLYSPDYGYVLLYTRSEGSGTFNSDLEYGKHGNKYRYNNSSGVEASISFMTNPKNPFKYPNPHKPDFKKVKEDEDYYDPETMDKVSATRLDLEGRTPGAPANDLNRDPVNEICTVSVDLAAINDRSDTPSGKIARLFSVGGALRTELTGTDSALNHNTHYFDQDKYGRASGFKELVDYTDNIVLEWCKDAPLDRRYDNALLAIRKMPDSQLKEIIKVYNGLSSDEKERVKNGILPIEMVRKEMKRRARKRGKVASGASRVAAKKSV